jgi:plastocyanin
MRLIRNVVGALACLGLLVYTTACFSDRSATGPTGGTCNINLNPSQYGSTIIAIQGFSFQPTPVHVRVGGKVSWLNCEPAGTPSHTTTADAGAWTSSLLDPGSTFTFTFNTAGTFDYHCEPHPSMTAQIIVDP